MFRNIIKKLNNFRLTSVIVACASGLAALYSLASLFLYHFSGDLDPDSNYLVRFVGFSNLDPETFPINPAYLGMILYFFCMGALLTSLYVAYSCRPFIMNKEKVLPRKGLLLAGAIGAVFELGLIAMMIVLLLIGEPNTSTLIIVSLPFGGISAITQCLYLIPWARCDFFMPEIKK